LVKAEGDTARGDGGGTGIDNALPPGVKGRRRAPKGGDRRGEGKGKGAGGCTGDSGVCVCVCWMCFGLEACWIGPSRAGMGPRDTTAGDAICRSGGVYGLGVVRRGGRATGTLRRDWATGPGGRGGPPRHVGWV
jgi:hypothetical protein